MRDMWKLTKEQLQFMKLPKKTGGEVEITMLEPKKV